MGKHKSKKDIPIILSPDGVRIQVTTSSKMRFRNAVQADPALSALMKSIYERLIDKTNEGFGDPDKFGYAYPAPATLAKECGCSPRAVKENLTALEDGKTRKGVLIPDCWRIKVKRFGEKGKGGGRNKVNQYWLPRWHEFAGVDENGEPLAGETVNPTQKTVNPAQKTVNPAHENGEPGSPDSLPYSLPDLLNDSESQAAGGRLVFGPFGSFVDEANGHSISTTDCMSRRQQFAYLRDLYQKTCNRPADEDAWEVFRDSGIRFEVAGINIVDAAGSNYSFADCLSRKLWSDEQESEAVTEEDPPF